MKHLSVVVAIDQLSCAAVAIVGRDFDWQVLVSRIRIVQPSRLVDHLSVCTTSLTMMITTIDFYPIVVLMKSVSDSEPPEIRRRPLSPRLRLLAMSPL